MTVDPGFQKSAWKAATFFLWFAVVVVVFLGGKHFYENYLVGSFSGKTFSQAGATWNDKSDEYVDGFRNADHQQFEDDNESGPEQDYSKGRYPQRALPCQIRCGGKVVYDFMSSDPRVNPHQVRITSGQICQEVRAQYRARAQRRCHY